MPILLKENFDNPISRGTVIRCPGISWSCSVIDFMFVFDRMNEFLVIVTSGYKSGNNIGVKIPKEALMPGTVMISSKWLYENWSDYIDSDINPNDVWVMGEYPEPASIP